MKRLLLALCMVLVLGGNGWATSIDNEGTTSDYWIIDQGSETADKDVYLYFSDDGDDTAHSIRWDDSRDSFSFSNWTNANTIMGHFAGKSITTTGISNTFYGVNAGKNTTEGDNNTFIGLGAGRDNTTGHNNVFVGYWAGKEHKSSFSNVALGVGAFEKNTDGFRNIVIGTAAGSEGDSYYGCTLIGNFAGKQNTGHENVFIGRASGEKNTTGTSNTYIGTAAGYSSGVASMNVGIGQNALNKPNSGYNVAVGTDAGYRNSGDHNVFIGYRTGNFNEDGTGNVFIGSQVDDYTVNQDMSNTLLIDNELTATPLIYGEFDTDLVRVNGELDVSTTTGALIVPRLTTAERVALTAVNGMIIYNSTDNKFNFYENGAWVTKVNE